MEIFAHAIAVNGPYRVIESIWQKLIIWQKHIYSSVRDWDIASIWINPIRRREEKEKQRPDELVSDHQTAISIEKKANN